LQGLHRAAGSVVIAMQHAAPPSCGLAVENGGRLGEMAGGGKGALRRLIGAPNKAIITRPARDAGLP